MGFTEQVRHRAERRRQDPTQTDDRHRLFAVHPRVRFSTNAIKNDSHRHADHRTDQQRPESSSLKRGMIIDAIPLS